MDELTMIRELLESDIGPDAATDTRVLESLMSEYRQNQPTARHPRRVGFRAFQKSAEASWEIPHDSRPETRTSSGCRRDLDSDRSNGNWKLSLFGIQNDAVACRPFTVNGDSTAQWFARRRLAAGG